MLCNDNIHKVPMPFSSKHFKFWIFPRWYKVCKSRLMNIYIHGDQKERKESRQNTCTWSSWIFKHGLTKLMHMYYSFMWDTPIQLATSSLKLSISNVLVCKGGYLGRKCILCNSWKNEYFLRIAYRNNNSANNLGRHLMIHYRHIYVHKGRMIFKKKTTYIWIHIGLPTKVTFKWYRG